MYHNKPNTPNAHNPQCGLQLRNITLESAGVNHTLSLCSSMIVLVFITDGKITHYGKTKHLFGGIWCASSSAYAL